MAAANKLAKNNSPPISEMICVYVCLLTLCVSADCISLHARLLLGSFGDLCHHVGQVDLRLGMPGRHLQSARAKPPKTLLKLSPALEITQ